MQAALQKAIRRTHAWFSLSEYPLTPFEAWKFAGFLAAPVSLEEVMAEPQADVPEAMAAQRQERYVDAMRKMKKLKRAVWYLSRVPGVRSIQAVNTLGLWHTRADSDIDLLVRTAPGSVWTARLFSVLPFALLKQRPEDGRRDPFCFSFFADADVDLASVALPGSDPYLSVWLQAMVTVFDDPRASSVPRWLESFARRLQMKLFPKSIREKMNADTGIVVNDRMLKFHDPDRRAEYRDAWLVACEKLDCVA
jgi:hypothetical protein